MGSNDIEKFPCIAVINFIKTIDSVDLREYDISIGDIVIVHTVYGLRLGRVANLKSSSQIANKWVIAKIEVASIQEQLDRFVYKAKLEKRLDMLANKITLLPKEDLYQEISKNDEVMKSVLEEYKRLKEEEEFEKEEWKRFFKRISKKFNSSWKERQIWREIELKSLMDCWKNAE